MNIALDATPLSVPTGGVRRYTLELARALAENHPEDQITLVSDQVFEMETPLPNVAIGKGPRHVLERRWWSWGLQAELTRLSSDVFHGTDFSVPYLPAKPSIMTIHDLSPWMEPSWHAEGNRVRRRTPMLLRLGLATVLITPSDAVRRQVVERFRSSPDRVMAIPLAASSNFRPVPACRSAAPYFLYVGTLEPRKNLPFLIEVWRAVRQIQTVDLLLVGRRRQDFPEIPEEAGLRHLGAVPDTELPSLYAGALAFLYPSHYEGFGLPVLEAMQCGAAVFTSTDPAISEVCGDAAVRLDPQDNRAWVAALLGAVENPSCLQELRSKALRRAPLFSWSKTAAQTREAYGEAIRRFRKKRASAVPST